MFSGARIPESLSGLPVAVASIGGEQSNVTKNSLKRFICSTQILEDLFLNTTLDLPDHIEHTVSNRDPDG